MNLYNNEDENKGGAPVLKGGAPFKKTSIFGRTPMLSRAAGGIMDRLKNLSRRDMAFVGLGLSVLVMAPVAEYVMSKPSTDNLLAPGFGSREGSAATGLYEPGINALSQGSADGSGEVISPLSFRDPASLILGSQPAQAPAMSAPPPDMGMRDAMKDSGRAAFSAAAQSAGLPTVIPRMQSALRGVSSFAGGGEGSRTSGGLSGKAIIDDAKSASSKAAKRSMVGPVAMPGYRGVSSNTPNSASKSALEKLRSQADKSAGNFSGASAAGSLDRAAADAVNIGKGDGGFGTGSEGIAEKSPSNSTNKNSHSSTGESLEQMAAKQRMQKALDWEFFKQYEIPKQIIQAILTGFTGSLTKFVGGVTDDLTGQTPGAAPVKLCWMPKVCSDADSCATWIATYGTKPPYNLNPATAGPSDICSLAGIGAVSFSISPGKDGGTARAVGTCICGEGPKPTPPGFPAGSNSVLPPVVPVVPPGATTDTASPYASYDQQLATMITLTVKGESELANAVELPKTVASIVGGFTNLAAPANQVATGLGNDAAANATSLDEYTRAVGTSKRGAQEASTSVGLFRSKLNTIAAATTLKQRQVGEALLQFPADDAALIKEKARRDSELLATTLADYNKLVAKQEAFAAFYTAQNLRVNEGLAAIRLKITPLKANADAVVTAGGPAVDQFKKITGRPTEMTDSVTPAPVNSGNGQQINDGVVTHDENLMYTRNSFPSDLRCTPNATIPLKDAVMVRGANWTALWQNPQHLLDASSQTLTENAAWVAFNSALTADTPAQPADASSLANFASNGLRSASLKASIALNKASLTGLDGNAASLATLIEKMLTEYTSSNLNACYFSGSCDGTAPVNPVNPVNPVDPAALTGVQVVANADGVIAKHAATMATAQRRYAAVLAAKANCTSEICKTNLETSRTELLRMTDAKAEILTLKEEAGRTGANAPTPARLAAINARITALDGIIADASGKFNSAAAIVEYRESLGGGNANSGLPALRVQAQAEFDKIVAAQIRGNTAMQSFPTGSQVEVKRAAAQLKMDQLNALKIQSAGYNVTAQNTASNITQVRTAKTQLAANALTAKAQADAIEALKREAAGLPSANCWENEAGCSTVSNFYMFRQWRVQKRLTTPWSGAYLSAWDWAYKNRTSAYSSRSAVCDAAWDSVSTIRAIINLDSGMSTAQCNAMFVPGFSLSHRASVVNNSGDFTSFTLARTSNGATVKTYEGQAQSGFNGAVKIRCEKSAGKWKTVSASFRVDQPTTITYSSGVNMSVGPSWLKVGAAETNGVNSSINFGDWQAIYNLNDKTCGTIAD